MKSPSPGRALRTPAAGTAAGKAAASLAAAGNARLTALAGITLLALFTAELVTVILGVSHVLTAHIAIGLALTPVVAVKIGSTGWRFIKYYRGDRAYRARGTPSAYLRILGPLLILATVVLLGSGMLAYAGPHSLHGIALTVHKTLFYPWLLMLIVHTAAHFTEAMRLAAADLLARSGRLAAACTGVARPRAWLAGVRTRRYVLAVALGAGAILAFTLAGHAWEYLHLYPRH